MKDRLVDELELLFLSYGAPKGEIRNSIYIVLEDYEVEMRKTDLSVRNEDRNNMLLQKFIVAKTVKGCTDRTLRTYAYTLKKILENINKTADEITADDVRIYLAVRQKRDGISKGYADTELRYMRSFFGFLSDEGLIEYNPVKKIEKIRGEKKKKKAFSEMEIEKIRDSCRTKREKCVVEMLFSTGCRVSELVAMKISEVEGDKIIVHGKGNKDRTVYLNAKAVVALKNYLEERKDKNPYIFPGGYFASPQKGKPALWYTNPENVTPDKHSEPSTIESMIRRTGKRAGVKNTHPHRFRRTCATMALRHGMPLMTVSKMLGHESVATTQIYLDLDEREVEQAHRKYVV